jgi:hypothetical protein
MALFTSTPKSKAGEKVSLLALDCSDDDNSSGYDSPVYINDEKCGKLYSVFQELTSSHKQGSSVARQEM